MGWSGGENLNRPSRTVWVAGVAGLSLFLSLSGFLVAALGDAPNPDAAVGEPRHGDRVTYVRVQSPDSVGPEESISFEWLGSATRYDPWGRAFEVDLLAWYDLSFTAGTHFGFLGGAFRSVVLEALEGVAPNEAASPLRSSRFDPQSITDPRELCLARAPWQGRPFSALEGTGMGEYCPEFAWARDQVLVHVGKVSVGPFQGDRFATVASNGEEGASVAFAPGLPYPLEFAVCTSLDCPTYRLQGFQRGTGAGLAPPVALLPLGTRDASGFTSFAERGSDPGIPGDVTMADAKAAAESSEDLGAFRAWLADHPVAQVADANFQRGRSPSCPTGGEAPLTHSWMLIYATPAGDSYRVDAAYRPPCPETAGLPQPLSNRLDGNGWSFIDSGSQGSWLIPAALPDRIFLFAAAVADFEATRMESGAGANEYGFRLDQRPDGSISFDVDVVGGDRTERVVYDGETGEARWRLWAPEPGSPDAAAGVEPVTTFPEDAEFGTQSASLSAALSGVPPAWFLGPAAASALVLLLLLVVPRFLPALVVGYSRLTRREVAQQPARAAILELLGRSPGLGTGEVQDAIGLGEGATRHHLHVLHRAGYVTRLEAGGFTRYFVAGSADFATLQAEAVLLSAGSEARILAMAQEAPGLSAADVARRLGVSRAAVQGAVTRLQGRGLVERRREGVRLRIYPKAMR